MKFSELAHWKGVRTAMIIAALGWAGTVTATSVLLGWTLYWEIYTPQSGMKDSLASYIVEIQSVGGVLEQILDELGVIKANQEEDLKRDLTVRGFGVGGEFGGDRAYVRVNADSDAAIYRDGDRVRITNTSIEGRPSEVFDVRGEWTHTDQHVLVSFSKEACEVLEIEGIVKVTLEPYLAQ